jgi:membrane-associated phospholipid phosphatase
MEYFVSHIGVIFAGACLVALAAVAWWLLTERNAKLIRQRAEARRKAVEIEKANEAEPDSDDK